MRAPAAYGAAALGALAGAAWLVPLALVALHSPASRTVGTSPGALASLALAAGLPAAVFVLAVSGLRHRRASACLLGGLCAAAGAALAAFATTPWALAGALALAAPGLSVAVAVGPQLLAVQEVRVRPHAVHAAAAAAALAAGAGLLALLTSTGELTWRAGFLTLAGLTALLVALAIPLRDRTIDGDETELAFGEIARGVTRLAAVRRVLGAQAALGTLVVPLLLIGGYALEDRWSLNGTARLVVIAAVTGCAAGALLALAGEGERLLARGPDALLRGAAATAAIGAGALPAAALAPVFGVCFALLGLAVCALALAWTAAGAAAMVIVAPGARRHTAVLGALAALGTGGLSGVLVTGDLVEDLGPTAALCVLALAPLIAALALRGAAETAAGELAATEVALAEERAVRAAVSDAPLVACRDIMVAFGHRRALDGVDLEVREGELLALLGTNGAGKSTLLRVLSGLIVPDRGSVRLDGRDITLADPERRFALGIGHVAGAEAVFGSLRVLESLELAGHAAGLRGADLQSAVSWALDRFPRLGERSGARVAALSGGERQMLALSQMLLRAPRLLLVDELSLGLAGSVVDELLEVVREIHAAGSTVVVVEQSADLALSLATRAVFLERGRVRFEGDPEALRARDDLIRPVFLAGASG